MSSESTEVTLRKENESLKVQVKELETKLESLETELQQSTEGIKRLETLCAELEKQNSTAKGDGVSKIGDTEKQGLELAAEVSASMEFAQNVNKSIEKTSEENKQICTENLDLVEKMQKMQTEHDAIEEEMKTMLLEQCDEIVKIRTEIGEVKLQNAKDKERLYSEMQQLASTLLASREQMRTAKETELSLRQQLQNYDKKFEGLQSALRETNTAYDGFKGEMTKVCARTKELESETLEWKDKWAESNTSLQAANEEHNRVQVGIAKSHEGLAKMTSLCRALQAERKELLDALKRPQGTPSSEHGG